MMSCTFSFLQEQADVVEKVEIHVLLESPIRNQSVSFHLFSLSTSSFFLIYHMDGKPSWHARRRTSLGRPQASFRIFSSYREYLGVIIRDKTRKREGDKNTYHRPPSTWCETKLSRLKEKMEGDLRTCPLQQRKPQKTPISLSIFISLFLSYCSQRSSAPACPGSSDRSGFVAYRVDIVLVIFFSAGADSNSFIA